MITPTTETMSIGLPADALAVMVFAVSLIKFTVTEKLLSHLPGLAKTSPARTQTATNHTTGPLVQMVE